MYVFCMYINMYVCVKLLCQCMFIVCCVSLFACLFDAITTGRCNRFASRDGIIGIATGLPAGRSRVRIPVGAREFFLLQNVELAVGSTQSPTQGVPAFFPVDGRPGHEVSY